MLDHATGPDLPQALRHEGALRRLAAALLRDPTDVDDAVQHALAQEGLGRRRPGAPLLPFLRATVRRWASNLRTLARRRQRREAAAARPEALPSAMEIAAREQLRRRVADAVQALDEPYRSTVWLRWFEGLAAHEVAARMAVPVATVRTRLQRAHARLRQRLDRDYGDRAAWAACALPFAELAPVAAALAFGVALPKVLASAAAVLLLVCGYVMWPAAPQLASVGGTRDGVGVAAVTAPGAGGNAPAERELVPAAEASPSALAAARQVQILYADSSPARSLPVLLWRADDRPRWATRVDDSNDLTMAPGIANAYEEPKPPAATLATDAQGLVALPPGGAEIAVSVEFAKDQWFSADLPQSEKALVLPALGELEVVVQGAPAGARWEGLLYPGFVRSDGSTDMAGGMRENLTTASGAGVVRLCSQKFALEVTQRARATMLRGHLAGVDAWGIECELRRVSSPDKPLVPAVVEYTFVKTQPVLEVRVVELTGAPSRVPGTAHLVVKQTEHSSYENEGELLDGVARLSDLEPGRSYPLAVLLGDGELLMRDVAFAPVDGLCTVQFVRGEGRRGLRVRLPEFGDARQFANAFLESCAGVLSDCDSPGGITFYDPRPKVMFAAGVAVVHGLSADARRVWMLASDGRVAAVPVTAPEGEVDAQWLPSVPIEPIDVGALYREHGDLPMMQAYVETCIVGSNGDERWWSIVHHLKAPKLEYPTPPPVWRGLQAPAGLRTRLHVRGGPDFGSPARIEREYDLPRR